jgi:regulator of cell morphogenesis and NO signaling
MTTAEMTVRDIALERPEFIRVFERYGIDYCCGGRKPLAEACITRNLSLDEVQGALDAVGNTAAPVSFDWQQLPMRQLIDHIVTTHHAYVKSELPRLAMLAQKVVKAHGDTQPHLLALQSTLAKLDDELTHHLMKEEQVLFPYIAALETAIDAGSALPDACFGSVAQPIAMMTSEHDVAGELLREIEQLSNGFTPPMGACPTYLGYYAGLKEFQQDLHQHIHLENNILFPRAIAMEGSTVGVAV